MPVGDVTVTVPGERERRRNDIDTVGGYVDDGDRTPIDVSAPGRRVGLVGLLVGSGESACTLAWDSVSLMDPVGCDISNFVVNSFSHG